MTLGLIKSHTSHYQTLQDSIEIFDSILVTGPASVGKTSLVKRLLHDNSDFIHSYIDCNSIATPQKLYNVITKSLRDKLDSRKLKMKLPDDRVNGAPDFLRFSKEYKRLVTKNRDIFIILDQIELFKMTPMVESLKILATMPEFRLIIISNDSLVDAIGWVNPASLRDRIFDRFGTVNLQPWLKEDLIQVILAEPPTKYLDLYEIYVNNVVNLAYTSHTKDYLAIRTICQENFENFLGFYKSKILELDKELELGPDDSYELPDNQLEEYSPNAVKRILSSFLDSFLLTKGCSEEQNDEYTELKIKPTSSMSMLVISIYAAAYTTPSDDKRNWIKLQRRNSKRSRNEQEGQNGRSRPFTLERLLHIYQALKRQIKIKVEEGEADSNELENLDPSEFADSILGDLKLLEDIKFLRINAGDGLDTLTRYKISPHITRNYVQKLALSVGYTLENVWGLK